MIRTSAALAAALLLTACGGEPEPAETPAVEAGEVDLSVATTPSPATWQIARGASMVGFRGTQNDRPFEGRFTRWNAGIVMDPEAPGEEGQIEAMIDLASADAGNDERNEALPGEDWFNTALHPVAVFRSNDISQTGEGAYVAEGTLTIKGITREVSMPFTLSLDENGRAVADGSVILDRSQFGVGAGQFAEGKWVGLEVEVVLHIEAVPAEA